MTATGGSAFVRRQLGQKLERLRAAAKKSQIDVETAQIMSRTQVYRIERGISAPRWASVRVLCEFYGADAETTAALIELAKGAKRSGWFEAYGDAVPKRLGLYLGAELAASRIDTYDPEVIHGVLQTRDYARALFLGERPDSVPAELDRLLDARRERQEMFFARRPKGAMLRAVLNEAALARQVGGRGTMVRQLDHLSELDAHEGVDVYVLPLDVGAHRAIYGGFTVLDFPDPLDPTVAYVDNYTGGTILDEDRDVRRMRGVHAGVLELSIPLKEYRDG
jgi:transcriptional regulator with XRE-family HTH domain